MDKANDIDHIESLSDVQAQVAHSHSRASFLLARTGGK
jgi:hypothetical protein